MNNEDRFFKYVEKTESCWNWTASLRKGYGRFSIKGESVAAHRYSYELLVGKIPKGLHLDHLCRNRRCVNPAHLEPVTLQENLRRGEGNASATKVSAYNRRNKMTCRHGHLYDSMNTYHRPDGGRDCKQCRSNRSLKFKEKGGAK